MSIELRYVSEGECDHGPKPIGAPRFKCQHYVECDWGRIEHPDPRPDLNQVGHLILTARDYVDKLLTSGPTARQGRDGRIDSATSDGRRLFVHSEHRGSRWTWELFDAYWEDGIDNGHRWLIGRWPD